MARESIGAIKMESGEIIREEGRVMEIIGESYSTLYAEEEDTAEIRQKRETTLELIDRRLTAEQKSSLDEEPSEELIEEVVRSLPKDKSPGCDGVIAEVLLAGWEFMCQDCYKMVRQVWRLGRILRRDNRGVIKLIPKAEDLELLKNWRPITLLTLTYKIIAKVIAWRLKSMLGGIIDQQQSGFIAGRSIVDNILSLRMAQDWVMESEQEAMFVRLDFQKAYDRVSHPYLWDTLAALGMSEANIRRIRGLVTGGSAQVHVNGGFTHRFEVQRGVRQGCPLAPLLFAMTTQPLMRLLREEESQGRILGVTYGGESTLLHQIYADDTGINITMCEEQFTRLRLVIHDFEGISGAKLNLNKSLIMPIRPINPPAWVQESGCEIAGAGRGFRYLGISTSHPVEEAQLMSVGLHAKGLEELEKLCRQFLWGWNDEGSPKASVIAWERLSQCKDMGGLGWTQIKVKAQVQYIKNVLKVVKGDATEWVSLAKNLILRTLRKGKYQRERRQ
ncbi:hypothetical protein R1sor_015596 [Riccia sorocarpa]|uniref:Reverse transcriptase domain-containing protein n=1 Tax=Riccia sorocarpa TaxID=122646 RepID=A0ABD3HFD7_9MARC